jgi:hypothetical protein
VILADLFVGEEVIAELLGVPRLGTMAEHQPSIGTKHCDVVCDVARVRRAGANVDHADAAGSLLNQMKAGICGKRSGGVRWAIPFSKCTKSYPIPLLARFVTICPAIE